ncbi:MAG: intradiol ring-cleavage dioxygenase [Caldilineae bacterium]|nr:intradiol ring-cleavage dioxygenase [Caldilineae bacterium]
MPHAAHDDAQIGRILSRREILALLGLAGGGALAGCARGPETVTDGIAATPTRARSGGVARHPTGAAPTTAVAESLPTAVPRCVVRPEQTAGPFYVYDPALERSDIRRDQASGQISEGLPLALEFRVSRVAEGVCEPLPLAYVDLWHCDARGVYSGFGEGRDEDFLRGYQRTGADGRARFATIYPGWYPGRAVHIHFTIRGASFNGYTFTSQLYFDDAISEQVFAQAPYAARAAQGLRNAQDGLYRDGGEQLRLALSESGEGYAAVFDIGLQLG